MNVTQSIFESQTYKEFVEARIQNMPARGRGEFRKIASALRVHSTRVSQIFRGDLHLTLEQACDLARYLGLSELETECLLALVQRDRAGTPQLRQALEKQLQAIRQKSRELVHRVERSRILTEQEKSTFYSNWYYSGIRMASSVPELQSLDRLAKHFDLPRERVRKVLDFLVQTGLCVEEEGRVRMGPKLTHLESDSPLVSRHHANWRLKAMQRHEKLGAGELAYSAPMVLSQKDRAQVREMAALFIEKVLKLVKDSEPNETLSCLCLDWFEF